MKNKLNLVTFVIVATLFMSVASCQKAENKNAASNTTGNTATANSDQSSNAATPPPVVLSPPAADSPTSAYKAAYTARKNKDIEGLKKLMSKDVIEFLTMIAEADPKKKATLDDQLKELCDKPQAATAEARNEKIDGNYATVEYLDEKGGWKTMEFIKEDGVWKMAFGAPKKDSPDKAKDDKDNK